MGRMRAELQWHCPRYHATGNCYPIGRALSRTPRRGVIPQKRHRAAPYPKQDHHENGQEWSVLGNLSWGATAPEPQGSERMPEFLHRISRRQSLPLDSRQKQDVANGLRLTAQMQGGYFRSLGTPIASNLLASSSTLAIGNSGDAPTWGNGSFPKHLPVSIEVTTCSEGR
jgi:hypothetical protein